MREFKYFGFTFKKNNIDEAHIKDVLKRAAAAMTQIWGIGERKFGGDFDRRVMIFNLTKVKSILLYGIEIWGWKKWKEIEALQEIYMRWILGLERCTPDYIVRAKIKLDQISIKAGNRALRFQEKIKRGTENKILKECRREIGSTEWTKTQWSKKMQRLYEERESDQWTMEIKDNQGVNVIEK